MEGKHSNLGSASLKNKCTKYIETAISKAVFFSIIKRNYSLTNQGLHHDHEAVFSAS